MKIKTLKSFFKAVLLLSVLWILTDGNSLYAQMYSVKDSVMANGVKCRVFTHPKKNKQYILTEKRSDISLGCRIEVTENGIQTQMKDFSVAAYTRDETGRMNYNSILPYISIANAGKRTVVSFECSFIVINPDKLDERIEETKNLYGLLTGEGIELKSH